MIAMITAIVILGLIFVFAMFCEVVDIFTAPERSVKEAERVERERREDAAAQNVRDILRRVEQDKAERAHCGNY